MEGDENVCDICNEDFDRDKFEPRKLPCCHTYCLQCLENLISPTTTITCPNNRSVHQLGHLGVFGLPVDTSKLPDANSRRSQTPDDSVVFSSDFINPSRPSTSRSNFNRAQNHMDVVHPGIEANPRMQTRLCNKCMQTTSTVLPTVFSILIILRTFTNTSQYTTNRHATTVITKGFRLHTDGIHRSNGVIISLILHISTNLLPTQCRRQ